MGFFARFGVAGDGSDPRVVGDIVFAQPVASAFWTRGGWGQIWLLDFYTPPSAEVVGAAQLQWDKLQNHVDLQTPSAGRAQNRLNALRSALAAPVSLVNRLIGTQEYRLMGSALQSITAAVSSFGKESWPDPQEELEAADAAAQAAADAKIHADAKAVADKAIADAAAKKTQDSIAAAQAAIAEAQRAKAAAQHSGAVAVQKRATAGGGGVSPLLIAAIGAPLALVAVFALKSKKSSVGRYRRRRR